MSAYCGPVRHQTTKKGLGFMTKELNIGDKIPQFRCKDEEGIEITNDAIIGMPLVIYFYPKDDTPGCTAEACSFRDHINTLENTDTIVIGVSPDSVESHQKFTEKHDLNFTLLSDPEKTMCRDFGVLKEGKVERTTFVVDPNGIISWIERPVNVEGHTERVLKAVNASA